MKSIASILIIFFASISLFADQPLKLGKFLSKHYTSMKDNDQAVVYISFTDKGDTKKLSTFNASSLVSERSLNRRLKARGLNNVVDENDLPLERSYVSAVSNHVVKVRHELKWFNALSVIATKQQIDLLKNFPFVKEIELVGRWKAVPIKETEINEKESQHVPSPSGTTSLDYGASFTQVNQIKIPDVHNLGIYGQGVVVGVFDNGFRLLTHESFASMNIIAQHDFVDHKESVKPNNDSAKYGSHGVNTLSTIGGYKPGQLIGPAFKASYILARTENDSSETPVEEDNWAKAIEWADSIGVDVTSTSLAYLDFDPQGTGGPDYTWQDMDGNTTLITKAADRAAGLGIVVVNSAGNQASDGTPNTLWAPADGDSVITAGAVNSSGIRATFSSYGPTYDGRIKPDIMAMGDDVRVASSTDPAGYRSYDGTSFSCPLSAGVAALILCANPTLTPMQVRDAMRQTASQAAAQDNLMGWGILNADSAIKYFGALSMGCISGMKFNDLNGDGVKEPNEPPITGIKIYLTGDIYDSTYSDGFGDFSFNNLPIGNYTITEELQSGWIRTTSDSSYSINLLHGIDTSGFHFGNFRLGIAHGIAFNDTNCNGALDIGEHGLMDRVIHLFGPTSSRAVTDNDGNFSFTNLEPGTYTISESVQTAWFQTVPINYGSYSITVQSGLDTSGLIFGNYYFPDSTYQVLAGWNMLSLPKKVEDHSRTNIYPFPTSKAFIYRNGYIVLDTIPEKMGFWLKCGSAQNVVIQGIPRLLDTIDVVAGWNMIGTLSDNVAKSSVIQIPDSIITSGYFDCRTCYPGQYLEPHHAYWVKAKSNGKLVLNALASSNVTSVDQNFQETFTPSNILTIEDNSREKRQLYFEYDQSFKRRLDYFELPPSPPEGVFDVRYASGRMLEVADDMVKDIQIILSSAEYPVKINWKREDVNQKVWLIVDRKEFSLNREGVTNIENPISDIRLRLSPASISNLPEVFALQQNYPNPFNPSTTINYQLPTSSWVTLKIFNLLGQEVTTLVDEIQNAGYKSVEFDATYLSSGLYYYKFIAGNNVDVKKMILLR